MSGNNPDFRATSTYLMLMNAHLASREDLLYGSGSDNRSQYAMSTRSAGPYGGGGSRQNGHRDENGFKARIHVISPDRDRADGKERNGGSRKPFKTMINTATDNIQYRGDLAGGGRNIYQKNQVYRRPESEHYKVQINRIQLVLLLKV